MSDNDGDKLIEAAAVLLGTTPDNVEVVEMTILPSMDGEEFPDLPRPFVDFTPGPKYIDWLTKAAALLNMDIEEMKKDDCWYWCFDDGLRPEDAVAEYRNKVLKESP